MALLLASEDCSQPAGKSFKDALMLLCLRAAFIQSIFWLCNVIHRKSHLKILPGPLHEKRNAWNDFFFFNSRAAVQFYMLFFCSSRAYIFHCLFLLSFYLTFFPYFSVSYFLSDASCIIFMALAQCCIFCQSVCNLI